jgi:alpha-D-xyloside xylohydrolase
MPYIYTLGAKTTFDGYTPMRALVFDFPADDKVLDISDEFMFGPSLLVAPVTDAGATSRDVYLPKGSDWYDFWTGERIAGGQTIHRDAPLSVLPLYVRAGSILPLGPEEEYTGQYPLAPMELRIYPGADGDAKLYDDDGLTYAYEKGQYVWISMHWNDGAHTLTLDSQSGRLAGAPGKQDFHITIVRPGHGVGEAAEGGDQGIVYTGQAQQVQLK